jgi:enoyl-CoA hydratase/carnithine racemase
VHGAGHHATHPNTHTHRLSADEALAAGLVSRVVPPEQLLPEALKIADKLAT